MCEGEDPLRAGSPQVTPPPEGPSVDIPQDAEPAGQDRQDGVSFGGHDGPGAVARTHERHELRGTRVGLELLLTVLFALVLSMLMRVFVAEFYEIPSGSMLETIQLGDRLLGEKLSLRWEPPQAGDIVTFEDPDGSTATLIKRVIATEGQTVDLQDGMVIVDGVVLSEDYVGDKPSYALDGHASNLAENVTFPYVVPEGCVWVMGDNRTNSLDSRYFGAIPVSSVTSRAVFIFWPPSDARML